MKATNNLPKQSEIEEFLGREFFPKYQRPVPLSELVDLVQLEFQVSDEDRNLMCPTGHGSDGTILECLTRFALLRLEKVSCVQNVGCNIFLVGTKKYFGHISIREMNQAKVSLKILKSSGVDKETAMIMITGMWHDDAIEKAATIVYDNSLSPHS